MFSLVFLALMIGQAPAATPPGRFSSGTDLVVLHVTVVDRHSQYVADLPREAFRVEEEGRHQPITFFARADNPLTIGLVLDSSISMHRIRDAVIAAGMTFAESSRPEDEMFTINFNERVWPGLPDGHPFTSDREELRRALNRSTARGRTALFDALRTALDHLRAGQNRKKVLVVVSDGGDNASATRFDDVLAMALRMNSVIYTISIADQYNREGNPRVLRKLAAVTGGAALFLRNADEAADALRRIAREIRSGYLIGYVPPDGGEGYRAVRVQVSAPDRRKLTVRARSGYVLDDKR